MDEWQKRVVKEKDELFDKIHKLHNFLLSNKSLEIDSRERELLTQQLSCMTNYHNILAQRVAIWNQD